ncbi:hypothetical protein ACFXKR_30155 [Streptomyces violascens]|uniref:hypothetical protein n=1 Tax=Streptomyces violascens TaxID=67381 RepID=UPI0036BB1CAE
MDRTRRALTAVAAVLALPLVTAVHHTDRTPCDDRFDSFAGHPAGPAAVDGLGKITPGRTPLGDEFPGERPTDRGGNRVARPS